MVRGSGEGSGKGEWCEEGWGKGAASVRVEKKGLQRVSSLAALRRILVYIYCNYKIFSIHVMVLLLPKHQNL